MPSEVPGSHHTRGGWRGAPVLACRLGLGPLKLQQRRLKMVWLWQFDGLGPCGHPQQVWPPWEGACIALRGAG